MRRRVVGHLLYDSARAEMVVGLRAVSASERNLAYESEELSIDLHVEQGSEDFGVYHGQVVGTRPARPVAGARVALGEYESVVTTDEFGQFAISSLAVSQPRELRVLTPDAEVVCHIPSPEE